jgi:DNA-directed RNA polymerase specialized sigma24 family protein|tara:strand:+ start:81 stop:614 length:534 start_codon:yes stop_codon:yes gene_type:complete
MKSQKPKEHYVNNKEFLAEMIKYKDMCAKAEKRGRRQPPITNYMGECFLKIANHLSYRPNFINYTFKDDMISDGIENCLQYVSNFNPDKSNNPFAYFTQIIYYAFIRRIQKEKKQAEIKQKLLNRTDINQYETIEGDDSNYTNSYVDYMQKNVVEEKPKKEKKIKKKTVKKLELFMD